jgi:hypothetical protein
MANLQKRLNSSALYGTVNGVLYGTVRLARDNSTVRFMAPSRAFSTFSTVRFLTPYIEYAICIAFFNALLILYKCS